MVFKNFKFNYYRRQKLLKNIAYLKLHIYTLVNIIKDQLESNKIRGKEAEELGDYLEKIIKYTKENYNFNPINLPEDVDF